MSTTFTDEIDRINRDTTIGSETKIRLIHSIIRVMVERDRRAYLARQSADHDVAVDAAPEAPTVVSIDPVGVPADGALVAALTPAQANVVLGLLADRHARHGELLVAEAFLAIESSLRSTTGTEHPELFGVTRHLREQGYEV